MKTYSKQQFLFLCLILTSLICFGCSSFNGRSFTVSEVKYGSVEFQVNVAKYSGSSPSNKSLLILPPTGGENYIDRSYARDFSRLGYDVYILQSWTGVDEISSDLEIHQRLYGRGQKAIELVLSEISSPYIGLLGTSVGALHGAIAAAKQNKLDSVFIITGGAPIAEVIVLSDQKAMLGLKQKRKDRFGFKNAEENKMAIDKNFSLEPMQLGDGFKEKDLGMVIAENDETVPTTTQQNLKNYWQPKKVISYSSGHFWGIVRTWLLDEDEVIQFFETNAISKTN